MAKRIPGAFVPSDIRTQFDPKIMRAGAMAELLFRRANEYSKANGNNGVVYDCDLKIIATGIPTPRKHAAALEREGLWRRITDGWLIISWAKWNATSEEVQEIRASKRLGALRTNHKKGLHDKPLPECPDCLNDAE